jgi:hypothetical protein
MSDIFTLSIEPTDAKAFQHCFHLGTIEKLAREISKDMFHNRNCTGRPTCTVALMRAGKIVDVYDGAWQSDC